MLNPILCINDMMAFLIKEEGLCAALRNGKALWNRFKWNRRLRSASHFRNWNWADCQSLNFCLWVWQMFCFPCFCDCWRFIKQKSLGSLCEPLLPHVAASDSIWGWCNSFSRGCFALSTGTTNGVLCLDGVWSDGPFREIQWSQMAMMG